MAIVVMATTATASRQRRDHRGPVPCEMIMALGYVMGSGNRVCVQTVVLLCMCEFVRSNELGASSGEVEVETDSRWNVAMLSSDRVEQGVWEDLE